MGYTTKFSGYIGLSRKLSLKEAKQVLDFNEDPESISGDHPNSYMQWVPSESLDAIVWDGQEKFYNYVDWLKWIVKWLSDLGIKSSGELFWSGESAGDTGRIQVIDGIVSEVTSKSLGANRHNPLDMETLTEMILDSIT